MWCSGSWSRRGRREAAAWEITARARVKGWSMRVRTGEKIKDERLVGQLMARLDHARDLKLC
jgi:hypothetical protein